MSQPDKRLSILGPESWLWLRKSHIKRGKVLVMQMIYQPPPVEWIEVTVTLPKADK